MHDAVTEAVISFYFESGDFNGYPVYRLKNDFDLSEDEAKKLLHELIDAERVDVVFGNIHPNPHIKAFSNTSKAEQLDFLEALDFSEHFCLFPTPQELANCGVRPNFDNEPYKNELALGAGQLDYRVFDLSVLEYYRNDPRYFYRTDFINGQISIHDEHFESGSMPEHDQVLLQTFGFAHDKDLNRVAAVFLRYLSDLSPEHQKLWRVKQLEGEYQLHPDYLRNSMGHWGTRISIFEAFLHELRIINEMSALIGKPPLFRNPHENETPRKFGFLLRPTLAEFNTFVLLLDQLMSDNLNKAFFSPEVELSEDIQRDDGKVEVRQKGTIKLLEEWVTMHYRPADPEPLEKMIATFRKARTLRQKPAHAPQEDTFDQKYFREQRLLIIDAYAAIRTVRLILANHPKVRAKPPVIDEFLYEGKIWTI
ncbi:MAG: AAA family ATPase [Desulfobulbaceae bacterium]|nr:AAA family ATPase [Desulfobulbaceae bacterium]